MKIYTTPTQYLDVVISDDSYYYQEIMGDNNVVLNFSLPYYHDFKPGCYINTEITTGNNKVFKLVELGSVTKVSERQYDYTLTFESPQKQMTRYKFKNMQDMRLSFTLTAQPFEFVDHIVNNLNSRKVDGGGWTTGECLQSAEKTQSFSHNTILDALNTVAQLFDTEWEIIDKRINLRKVEYNKETPERLEYGRGNGFVSGISRQNSGEQAVDVLWVEGGNRNIDSSKYRYQKLDANKQLQWYSANTLRLPKNKEFIYMPPPKNWETKGKIYVDGKDIDKLKFNHTYVTTRGTLDESSFKGTNYIKVYTDEDGYGLFRKRQINNGYEDSLELTDIYPHKVLKVSGARLVNREKRFWNISATENSIDYTKYIIGDEKATVIFNTGMLTGKEFEFSKYSTKTREFEIVPTEIDGIVMPDLELNDFDEVKNVGGSGYVPQVGDEFGVFHVNLPDEYIEEAEYDLLLAACDYMYKHSEIEVEFNGTIDGIWSKNKWDRLKSKLILGGFIKFFDNAFCKDGKELRILSVKTYLNNPHAPELTLSNSSVSQGISSELKKIAQNQQYTNYAVGDAIKYAKRGFRDVEETSQALQTWAAAANEDLNRKLDEQLQIQRTYFTENISPVTIQTMQLMVGDKHLQLEFGYVQTYGDNNLVNKYVPYTYKPYWRDYDKTLVCPSEIEGLSQSVIMRHLTYSNVERITARADNSYPYWKVKGKNINPVNPDSPYYLYLIADKRAVSTDYIGRVVFDANFELIEINGLSTLPTDTKDDYYFLIGILNSEIDGQRSFSTVFGGVEISGNQIRVEELVSKSGDTSINLLTDVIQGQFNLKDGQISQMVVFGKSFDDNRGGFSGDMTVKDADFNLDNVYGWLGKKCKLVGGFKNYMKLYNAEIVWYEDGGCRMGNSYVKGSALFFHSRPYGTWIKKLSVDDGIESLYGDITANNNKISSRELQCNSKFTLGYHNVQSNLNGILRSNRQLGNYTYDGAIPVLVWYARLKHTSNSYKISPIFAASYKSSTLKFSPTVSTRNYYTKRDWHLQLPAQCYCKDFLIDAYCCWNENTADTKSRGYCSIMQSSDNAWTIFTADDASANEFDINVMLWAI